MRRPVDLGATPQEEGRCRFRVWAPEIDRMEVHLTAPEERVEPMVQDAWGYHEVLLEGVAPGTDELFRLSRELSPLRRPDKDAMAVQAHPGREMLALHRWDRREGVLALFHLGREEARVTLALPPGTWQEVLRSERPEFPPRAGGPWPEIATCTCRPTRSLCFTARRRPSRHGKVHLCSRTFLPAPPGEPLAGDCRASAFGPPVS